MQKHILIVDDNLIVLKIIENILNKHYKITLLKSGKQAISYLEKYKVDLILLDITMPEMDGYETLIKIKENKNISNIPVIFVTAQTNQDTETKALELGAVDFIRKPFVAKTMISRINTQLELNEYRQNLEIVVENKTRMIEKLQDALFLSFAELVECRDGITGGHVKRTAKYVEILIEGLVEYNTYTDILTEEYIKDTIRSAPLHDIGKIGIKDSILLKNGSLEEDEFEYMKQHSELGYLAIRKIEKESEVKNFLIRAEEMAHYHHERWDGFGYPDSLYRDEIPLCARIMSIADVYDAMTNKRAYKKASTHEEAFELIKNGKGTKFDPKIVDVFEKIHYRFEEYMHKLKE